MVVKMSLLPNHGPGIPETRSWDPLPRSGSVSPYVSAPSLKNTTETLEEIAAQSARKRPCQYHCLLFLGHPRLYQALADYNLLHRGNLLWKAVIPGSVADLLTPLYLSHQPLLLPLLLPLRGERRRSALPMPTLRACLKSWPKFHA